jgi:hypothetical protein
MPGFEIEPSTSATRSLFREVNMEIILIFRVYVHSYHVTLFLLQI